MSNDSRTILRKYYDAAASNYLDRASKGVMGWLRNRELALTLDMIPSEGDCKALDAGCGPGYYSQVLKERGFDVSAVDISTEMVKIVQELGFPAFHMDIEHSAPPEGLSAPFDFVLCAGVLEFAHDVNRFLGSIRSMMNEDGELVLIAPRKGAFGTVYRNYLKSKGIPAQVYFEKHLGNSLLEAGFEPVEVRVAWPICLAVRAKAI